MELSGLTNIYGDYLTQQVDEAKTAKMKNTVSKDYSQATDDELLDVCKQFEAYFLEQIFKQMEKTIIKDEENSSTSTLVDYFKDSAIADLATQSTQTQGLGIAEMLYEQMKRNYNL
ncbi:MAG: rod-binding protein [Lachnospiraceae bacterium]|nr:rod-binding protein [Lachnospiraceae bacterium]MDD7026981.1 rod-binding protein [Lachnospiraceae bacterium]MDY5700320.1 rod-binding protein [Lachnospiraceae bacterium]